ncbi:MAG: sporulation transcriptional regulator SpoIIID [Bacillota bacterium]
MKEYIKARILEVADYIIETGKTVRETAKVFDVSKSTVHKDMSERLCDIDYDRYKKVARVLKYNLQVRHIRGGLATQKKYQKAKTVQKLD